LCHRRRRTGRGDRRCPTPENNSMTLVQSKSATAGQLDAERVPFNDLSHQWRQIRERVLPDIDRLFEQGAFTLGPYVDAFECSAAAYLGAKHAIGVNSGTS